jgi:hypothetical protein
MVQEEYSSRVYTNLLEKKYFTKVEALEMFTNLWSLGIWPKMIPRHNTYNPATSVLNIPKFAAHENEDLDYRTKDVHSP